MTEYKVVFVPLGSDMLHVVRIKLDMQDMQVDGETYKSIREAAVQAQRKLERRYGNISIKSIEDMTG